MSPKESTTDLDCLGLLIIASSSNVKILKIINEITFILISEYESKINMIHQLEISGDKCFLASNLHNIDNLIGNNFIESFYIFTGEKGKLYDVNCKINLIKILIISFKKFLKNFKFLRRNIH